MLKNYSVSSGVIIILHQLSLPSHLHLFFAFLVSSLLVAQL